MIVELLRHGKENARSRREIMDALGISVDRKFYSILAAERKQGAVILSGNGYYLPSEDAEQARSELDTFTRQHRKMAISNFASIKSATQAKREIQVADTVEDS